MAAATETTGPKAFSSKAKTVAKAAGAITVAFVAFMLLVHSASGRRLLAPFYAAKCPVGGQVTGEQVEASRLEGAKLMLGTELAPARPALGFELDKTRPEDVRAWAQKHSVACAEERGGALFRCTRVKPSALTPAIDGPELSEVLFAFEPKAMTLVSVTAYHESVSEDVAAARGSAVAASLEKSLGAPHKAGGRFEAAYLAEAALRTATVGYAYRDYVGGVSATKLRPGTTMLREQYMTGMR